MPFINIKTNTSVSKDTEEKIKSRLGVIVTDLPGKSEQWLMVNIEDNERLWFRGNNEPCIVFAEVKLFGSADRAAYDKMTKDINDALDDLIGAEEVYVKYEEVENWGYNGSNF